MKTNGKSIWKFKKCLVNTYSELKNIKELVIFFILNFVLFKEM